MSKTLLTNNKKCAFKERTIKNEKIISFVLTAVLLLSVCLIPAYTDATDVTDVTDISQKVAE